MPNDSLIIGIPLELSIFLIRLGHLPAECVGHLSCAFRESSYRLSHDFLCDWRHTFPDHSGGNNRFKDLSCRRVPLHESPVDLPSNWLLEKYIGDKL